MNTDFKGTRGAWLVKHSESKDAWNVIGKNLGGKYKVARCPYVSLSGNLHQELNKISKNAALADACLIAAAPDLLEALQDVLSELNVQGHGNYILSVRKANSAIAKALGNENL